MKSSKKWRVAHASVTGAAHVAQNTVCQDRFSCRTIETADGEVLIAAIADGAGSTRRGERGAEIVCRFFVEQIEEFLKTPNASVASLNEEFGKLLIRFVREKIAAVALAEKKPTREFASTFLGAVVGKNAAAFYQIGDGAIVFSAVGAPHAYRFGIVALEAEYVNMTDFITDDAVQDRLRFAFLQEAVEDLILFSDGLVAVAVDYKTLKPHAPFLTPMIAPLRSGKSVDGLNEKLETFLASPKINEKTDDDKTIILASRAAGFEKTAV